MRCSGKLDLSAAFKMLRFVRLTIDESCSRLTNGLPNSYEKLPVSSKVLFFRIGNDNLGLGPIVSSRVLSFLDGKAGLRPLTDLNPLSIPANVLRPSMSIAVDPNDCFLLLFESLTRLVCRVR